MDDDGPFVREVSPFVHIVHGGPLVVHKGERRLEVFALRNEDSDRRLSILSIKKAWEAVSRILSRAIIHLGDASPQSSSDLRDLTERQ